MESRRWTLAVPLLHDPGETLEGGAVLEEVSALHGALLWLALRDVVLLNAVEPGERESLFAPGAADRRRALGALPAGTGAEAGDSFTDLIAHPQTVHPAEVARACAHVAAWAEARGALRTALAFTQAAALLRPESAAAALAVGEAAAQAGQAPRAGSWIHRAIGLARRSGERDLYVRAYLVLGRMLSESGRPDAARVALTKAVRAARRFGVRNVAPQARHLLFRIARAEGRPDLADRFGKMALRTYPRDSAERTELAVEMARAYLERGAAARALPLLRMATRRRGAYATNVEALALFARAAAVAGDRAAFDDAWSRAWHLVRMSDEASVPPVVHADLTAAAEAVGRSNACW
jgi:tetratricopeptide (TPR) repeat protein